VFPTFPQSQVILTDMIPPDPKFRGLRIVHYQSKEEDAGHYLSNHYQFQHQPADYTMLPAVLCRKGFWGSDKFRVVSIVHPHLKLFTSIVQYNPAEPPDDNYEAQGMQQAHQRTQSDFKGQKKANTLDFKNYILEGIQGNRTLYLPTITGWQSNKVLDRTVFVAMDESDPNAMYGHLYLPKKPVMQADGQTQTAALFAIAASVDAHKAGALDELQITLEIEFGLSEREAGQSFADRNGRGSKKNRNLVISLDTSSALSELRVEAAHGTVFADRLADGRTTGTTETATAHIVDLSTMEQMLLNAISGGSKKSEHIKHHHVAAFLPYCQEFLTMLDELFARYWPENTPPRQDPFRKLYVHGWPFCLKALALAYYESRINELGPLNAAVGTEVNDHDASKKIDEKFNNQVEKIKANWTEEPRVSFAELKERLYKIDWLRYRKHWIELTGYPLKNGKKKTFKLKSTGELKVMAYAQNTPGIIGTVRNKILSDTWQDLCQNIDEPIN
jgi:DNA-sulfur modification-associated